MKKAYIVGHITIKNKEKWEDYRSRVPDTLEPYGAELIFRGKLNSILSGNHAHTELRSKGSDRFFHHGNPFDR